MCLQLEYLKCSCGGFRTYSRTLSWRSVFPQKERLLASRMLLWEACGDLNPMDPWSSNSYMNLLARYSRISNTTECWICGAISFSEEGGYPFIGVPWTLEDLKRINTTGFGWYREEGMPHSAERLRILNIPKEGTVCVASSTNGNNATQLGHSNCSSAWIKGHGNVDHWNITVNESTPIIKIIKTPTGGIIKRLNFPFIAHMMDTCFSGPPDDSYNVLPRGVYFLCGNWAYRWLPQYWEGECYIGSIIPAIRRVNEFPTGRIRNRRWTNFIGDIEANSGIVFPSYGVYWAFNRLETLYKLFDEALNSTMDSIDKLSQEQIQIRAVALQNRLALDYLLAAKGGVCGLVGNECCTYIINNAGAISHDLSKIVDIQKKLHEPPDQRLFSWFGNLGGIVVHWMLMFIVICVLAYLCLSCIQCIMKRVICKRSLPIAKVSMHDMNGAL